MAEAAGWSSPSFRAFYLFGAILNVPWLALGTVFLLAGRRIGDGVRWGRPGLRVRGGRPGHGSLRAPVPSDELPEGSELFEPLPRILAAVGSGVAALVSAGAVVGVASGPRPVVGRTQPGRDRSALAFGNVVIALGTGPVGQRHAAGRLGKDTALAVTLVAGVVVLFCGFLIATPGRPARAPRWLASS